jgi:enoyl-CoA hydratase
VEFVRLEVADGIGTLRLDRPPMNALNRAVRAEVHSLVTEATERADVRALVLYGGEKVFAAGADIKEMSTYTYPEALEFAVALQQTVDLLARVPKPTVAAITGYALGGGLELAMAADFRVVADNAKVGQPEILLGVIPGAGGTQRLPRLIGPARAKDLIFTGRMVRADEAERIGLADRVVPAADVYTEALATAKRFAAGPAVALRAAKQAIDDGLGQDLGAGLRLETTLFAALFGTEDQRVGMESFLANGPGRAAFVGR